MTVEEYLRSLVPGLDLQENVIARAARSPIEVNLERLDIDDDVDDYDEDEYDEDDDKPFDKPWDPCAYEEPVSYDPYYYEFIRTH